jgi:FtsP/CotA-like multicopper oxidase with cupredoxin domain
MAGFMNRRAFLGAIGAGIGVVGVGRALSMRARLKGGTASGSKEGMALSGAQERRYPLPEMQSVSGDGLMLTAAPTSADFGPASTRVLSLNDSFPAPMIRVRRGGRARIELRNELDEPTILHWHGLTVPDDMDGHPRFAIAPGARYAYEFEVRDRAGMYWYHPHTHRRTAAQTYMGMAGLLFIEDDDEAALDLPSGEYELPLILQDKRLGGGSALSYNVGMGPDVMTGYLGDTAFGNGAANPTHGVKRGRYRLRILNASNARVFDLGLADRATDGAPMTLIGTDGGLLEAPVTLDRIRMSTGERADILVDFSSYEPGDRVMLRSFDFAVGGMMGMGMGMGRGRGGRGGRGMGMMQGLVQGAEMDLLEFVVLDSPRETAPALPDRLSEIPGPRIDDRTPRRTFHFNSVMMNHTINGRTFEMERIDERVPLGQTEVWTIINESGLPHPVHIHAGQHRVLSRTGGRDRVMPWETGLKDTVLVMPEERIEMAVNFPDPGIFLMHCHNLEHEDAGMMMNFEVVE